MQRDQQAQLNNGTISYSFKNINEDQQSILRKNEKKEEQNNYTQNQTRKFEQNFNNMQNYNGIAH